MRRDPLVPEDFDWEGVEEFVGENDGRDFAARRFLKSIGRGEFCFSWVEVTAQSPFDPLAQGERAFDEDVAQGAKEIRKLFSRPVENILCKQTAAGAEFDQVDLPRRAEDSPHFVELSGQQAAENSVDVA